MTSRSSIGIIVVVVAALMCVSLRAQQWHTQSTFTYDDLTSVSFSGSDTGYVTAGSNIYRTGDGASSWQVSVFTSKVWRVSAPLGSKSVYAAGNGIYKSRNHGLTWETLNSPLLGSPDTRTNAISFSDSINGCACGAGEFECTSDGGASWYPGEAIPVSISECLSIQMRNNGVAFLGGIIYEYLRASALQSHDGGATWRNITLSLPIYGPPNGVRAIYFINDRTGFIAGPLNRPRSPSNPLGNHVLRTTDGGLTWEPPSYEFWYDVNTITFADSLRGFIGDEAGNIYSTTDGGTLWKNDSVPSNGRSINSICVAGNTRVFAVGDSGLILRYDLPTSVRESGRYGTSAPVLQLFPNPTSGIVRMSAGAEEIETITVTDALGNVFRVQQSGTTLDTSALPSGAYVVAARLRNATRVATAMLIVQ